MTKQNAKVNLHFNLAILAQTKSLSKITES